MMDSKSTSSDHRRGNVAVALTLLMGIWVIGGFVATMTVNWGSLSTEDKGHILTVWLMIAFALVASVYIAFARLSRLRVVPWVIVSLLALIEVILAISYFNW
jgi:hypothetical protein